MLPDREPLDLQAGERLVLTGCRGSLVVYDSADTPLIALRATAPAGDQSDTSLTYHGPLALVLSIDAAGCFALEMAAP